MDTREEKMTQRIQDIARKVCACAEANGKSLQWLTRKYDTLGSPRTLRDMRDGKVDGYNVEQQFLNYEAALALIEDDDPAAKSVRVITTLTGPTQIKRAVLEAMTANGNDRVILLLGDSGAGKTCAIDALCQEYDTAVKVEALEVWSDSPGAMLCDILEALGEKAVPTTTAYTLFKSAVSRLCKRRVTICIDEAHQMGPRCLNTIKGLVNETPGEFVLAGQPTLWTTLQAVAHLELRQLVTNRLRERITLTLNAADVCAFIGAVFPDMPKPERTEAAQAVIARSKNLGNMAFVRDCCAHAAQKAEDPKHPTADEWVKAAAATAQKK